MKLKGSVAVVTGAARGIGKAIAEAFASRGARVALVDVLAEALKETAQSIQNTGATALPIVADVTDVTQVDAMAAEVEERLGPIDILVNNAGTFSYVGPAWEADPERWFRDVRVNPYGSFLCCRAAVRAMVERERGYVINIVSSGGVGDPHPYSTSYASSKTGLMRLTEGLAKEVAEHGIKVFALAPPAILTEMTQFIMDDPGGKKWRPAFENIFKEGGDHPPEMVANWAVKLVSGRADALSGRYFLVTQDLDEVVGQTEAILRDDLLTLRIRK